MTTAVLISAIIEGLTNWRVDGVIGFLIACYILYSGISMVRAFINELMGSRPTQEDLSAMETRLNAYPEIYGYHDLLVHNYGPQKTFASVHIEVDDRWSLNQAHEVINKTFLSPWLSNWFAIWIPSPYEMTFIKKSEPS